MQKKVLAVLVLVYIPLVYFGIKSEQYASDEFFYMQMAKEVVMGHLPYRDFFFAHPPLMIFPIVLSYLIFGVSIAAGKLVPLISSFVALVFVYLIGEKLQTGVGALACLLMLTSPDFHSYSHNAVGLFLSLVFVLGSFYFYLTKRVFFSGLLITLALFVRLNTVPFFVVMLFLNFRDRKFYYGLLTCTPLLLFLLIPNFLDDAVLYHLGKEAKPLSNSITALLTFFKKNWFILLLSIIGLSQKIKVDRALVILPAFSIFFTMLFGVIYDFYFFLTLPFFALLGGVGIKQISRAKGNAIVALILIIALISSYQGIVNSYKSVVWVDKIIDYIEENTSPDDKILYVGGGNAYVAMKTNRDIAGNFIDISEQRFYVYNSTIDDDLLKSLKEAKIAVFDYKDMNLYSKFRNVDLSELKNYLRENFYPATYLHTYHQVGERAWWSETNLLMVWMRKGREGLSVREPTGVSNRYYLESYYFLLRNTTPVENFKLTERNQSGSQPYIADFLLGNNKYGMKFITNNFVRWPLTSKTHYRVAEEGITSDVWVGQIENNAVRLIVETYTGDDTISFSEFTYNLTTDSFSRFRVLSRYSEEILIGYLPTYRQVEISEEDYKEFAREL